MNKANKVVIKNAPNYEDFVAILLNNGYTVTTKQVSGGDQLEIQFYQEEPEKKEEPERLTPEELFGKIMDDILE